MNIKRRLKKDLKKLSVPEPERVLPIRTEGTSAKICRSHRPLGVMITAVALALLMIVGGVAAIPEIARYLNAKQFIEQPYRLTEVPDGWVGIYTLDDLEMLRDPAHCNTDFILMNDIDIPNELYSAGCRYENGFVPLGSYCATETSANDSNYVGIFNGNGHVIRNLKLTVPEEPNTGSSWKKSISVGLFGDTNAKITYLGVEDVEITLNGALAGDELYIGAMAGQADFVAGCYAENISICYNAQSSLEGCAAVGGLCGFAEYVDSCYVKNADLQIVDSGSTPTMLVGGVTGTAYSCVTSYFIGNIEVSAAGCETCISDSVSAMLYPAYTPVLLTEEGMGVLVQKLESSVDRFYYTKFQAYYVRQDLDEWHGNEKRQQRLEAYFERLSSTCTALYSIDVSEVRCWYVLADDASLEELNMITDLATQAFGSPENFEAFCVANNIKCGKMYCYGFAAGETVSAEDLEAFDFEHIWKETQDGIVLRAFVS